MKTIGMIGGMSWESTASYYQLINQGVQRALGGLHSAKICLYSVNFAEIEALQQAQRWEEVLAIVTMAGRALESAGADFIIICTNTIHKLVPQLECRINIPILHIADATADALLTDRITKVGLLGTRFTMEDSFYRQRLADKFGLDVVIPNATARAHLHRIIFDELCQGQLNSASKSACLNMIADLHQQGAQAVILACTELPLLLQPRDTVVPLYDTTALHAQAAVHQALSETSFPLNPVPYKDIPPIV